MPDSSAQPSRVRFALLVFVFVYPLVTSLLMIVLWLTPGWPLPLRTLLIVPCVVVAMVWGIVPLIQGRLRHLI